jgi:hypothetical protein
MALLEVGKQEEINQQDQLDFKKKGNTLSTILCFPIGAIKNYIIHSRLAHNRYLKFLEQQIAKCTQQKKKMFQNN